MPYRPTDRTRARLAQARERIVDAALDQLAEGGYASASMAAVARRSQVATGTVYRHFPSKQDLFAEVFQRASQREVDTLRATTSRGEPAAARLAAWVEVFVRRALAEPTRAYALIAEPVDPTVEAERLTFRRAYADLFARALRDGVESGELPALDPDLTAAAIVGALAEALVGPLQHRDAGADALVENLQTFVLRSVGVAHAHA
ncbi:MAG: TetR/AcrR family transcriptional regulator [Solirubrobacteraceae bacterium]